MSEYDGDEVEATDSPEEPVVGSDVDWQAKVKKLEQENYKLRVKARRSELGSKFGPEIAELVPDALPADEWEPFAAKLAALKGTGSPVASGDAPAEAEAPTIVVDPAVEAAMAAVVTPPAGGTTPPSQVSAKEIYERNQTDPKAALEAVVAKYRNR